MESFCFERNSTPVRGSELSLDSRHVLARNSILIVSGIVWIAALVHAAVPTHVGFIVLRCATYGMMAFWVVAILRSDLRLLILSPLFVLGFFGLIGYSFVETLFLAFPDHLSVDKVPDWRTLSYPGSFGEALVLQFVAFCCLITAAIIRIASDVDPTPRDVMLQHSQTKLAWVGALAVATFVAIELLIRSDPDLHRLSTTGLGKQLADCIEPLTAFCLAVLAYLASNRGGHFTTVFFVMALLYLIMRSWIGLVQMPILMVVVTASFYFFMSRQSLYTIGLTACAVSAVAVIMAFGIAQSRFSTSLPPASSAFDAVKFVLSYKVLLRQGRSAYCMDRIVTYHRPEPEAQKPFYFLSAIVPRALNPDKPNLSRGHEFATKYCGDFSKPEHPHYELVTILAEPVLEGGLTGLAIVQLFLAISLSLVALAMLRGDPVSLITIIALLPWLIHFQQSFALYFANAVKMFIYMLPAITLLWWWSRRQQSVEPDSSP